MTATLDTIHGTGVDGWGLFGESESRPNDARGGWERHPANTLEYHEPTPHHSRRGGARIWPRWRLRLCRPYDGVEVDSPLALGLRERRQRLFRSQTRAAS